MTSQLLSGNVMPYKSYDHMRYNTLACTHNVIDNVRIQNAIFCLNNVYFEGDKIPH